ncbi:hypothetical protein ABIC11_004357 [Pseudomonas oryzihabitans]
MSLREVDCLKIIQPVTECLLRPPAQRVQLITRQVHRLVQCYQNASVSVLTSR